MKASKATGRAVSNAIIMGRPLVIFNAIIAQLTGCLPMHRKNINRPVNNAIDTFSRHFCGRMTIIGNRKKIKLLRTKRSLIAVIFAKLVPWEDVNNDEPI